MLKKIVVIVFTLSISSIAYAQFGGFGIPSLSSFMGGGSVSPDKLVVEYLAGSQQIMQAQSTILLAIGNKDLADKAAADAANMKQGATSDAINDAEQVQTDSSKAIQDALADNSLKLDDAAKEQVALGYGHLAIGAISYALFVKDAKGYRPSVATMGTSAALLVIIVPKIPNDVSNLSGTISAVSTFSKNNNIELPKDSEDPTKALAGLM